MKKQTRPLLVLLDERDRTRLELIRDVFGVSLSAGVRVAIRAASEKLGFEKEIPDDLLPRK